MECVEIEGGTMGGRRVDYMHMYLYSIHPSIYLYLSIYISINLSMYTCTIYLCTHV